MEELQLGPKSGSADPFTQWAKIVGELVNWGNRPKTKEAIEAIRTYRRYRSGSEIENGN